CSSAAMPLAYCLSLPLALPILFLAPCRPLPPSPRFPYTTLFRSRTDSRLLNDPRSPSGVRHRLVVREDCRSCRNRRTVLDENPLGVEIVKDDEVTNLDRSADVYSWKTVECNPQCGRRRVPCGE